ESPRPTRAESRRALLEEPGLGKARGLGGGRERLVEVPVGAGEPLLRLYDAPGAQGVLDGEEDRLLDDPSRPDAHPGLGRMDVDVELLERHGDDQHGGGKLVAGEHGTV